MITSRVMKSSFGIRNSRPSRVTTETKRARSSRIQPKVSPSEMVSPGLMERSSRMMIPEMKFETTFCRPKPIPTPTAPENTVKAVRSMPMPDIAATTATTMKVIFRSFPIRTRRDGVSSSERWIRLSRKLPSDTASHRVTLSSTRALSTRSAEIRVLPSSKAMPSRKAATSPVMPSTETAT